MYRILLCLLFIGCSTPSYLKKKVKTEGQLGIKTEIVHFSFLEFKYEESKELLR